MSGQITTGQKVLKTEEEQKPTFTPEDKKDRKSSIGSSLEDQVAEPVRFAKRASLSPERMKQAATAKPQITVLGNSAQPYKDQQSAPNSVTQISRVVNRFDEKGTYQDET